MFKKAAAAAAASLLPVLVAGMPALGDDSAATFFKGREIKLIVGAGDGYDAYARGKETAAIKDSGK